MKYVENQMDIFQMPDNYVLMHCISADLAMGKGIAVDFNRKFNLKAKLTKMKIPNEPTAIKVDRVINLITKERYWHKPTKETFIKALKHAHRIIASEGIKNVAIPTLGADLDKLDWGWVRSTIKAEFDDLDVFVVVCINNPIGRCECGGSMYSRNKKIYCTGCAKCGGIKDGRNI